MSIPNIGRLAAVGGAVVVVSAWAGGVTFASPEHEALSATASHSAVSAAADCDEICCHVDGSRYECPDSSNNWRMFQDVREIRSATLVLTTADRRTITINVPRGTDALFLTPSAVESFLLRHYIATDGEKAGAIRNMLARVRGVR